MECAQFVKYKNTKIKNIFGRGLTKCTEFVIMVHMGNKKPTKAIGIRVEKDKLSIIEKRALKKGMSRNEWINWAIDERLRNHSKNGGN